MPELPDVEGFRRVASRASGHRVERVDVADATVLRGTNGRRLRHALRHAVLGTPRRHGKLLALPVRAAGRKHRHDEPSLVLHFGMTGSLSWCSGDESRHRHDRLVLATGGGELRYRDMRKLQGVRLASDDEQLTEVFGELGPDAAGLGRAELAELLRQPRAAVKSVLMDQRLVAGLGNLTVDEILWRARIGPARPARELTHPERSRLHRAMSTVLRQSVPAGRVPDRPSWLTGHRDEHAGRCPRCGTRLRRTRAGGRGTASCPRCQPS
ncbi:MAG: Fpg/Nei family DNA glycosylase [Actinophytocola sp.]|nr:Fpg/Nei family DNA glycosylase [Actinophytocola sp.]